MPTETYDCNSGGVSIAPSYFAQQAEVVKDPPMQSDQINELAGALAKAQGEIAAAHKDSENPFFKSSYADLTSCWDACRQALSKNGLAVIQTTDTDDGWLYLMTTLAHSSGQWIKGKLSIKPMKDTPQDLGSAITYARRYALCGIVGISPADDDGNDASGRKKNPPRQQTRPTFQPEKAAGSDDYIERPFGSQGDKVECPECGQYVLGWSGKKAIWFCPVKDHGCGKSFTEDERLKRSVANKQKTIDAEVPKTKGRRSNKAIAVDAIMEWSGVKDMGAVADIAVEIANEADIKVENVSKLSANQWNVIAAAVNQKIADGESHLPF